MVPSTSSDHHGAMFRPPSMLAVPVRVTSADTSNGCSLRNTAGSVPFTENRQL